MARMLTSLANHIWLADGLTLTISAKLEQTEIVGEDEVPLWPRFVLMEPVRGLRALPDMDANREDHSQAQGERPLKSYARGKLLTYPGRIYGDSWMSCAEGADAMLAALGPDLDTGVKRTGFMRIVPTVPDFTDQSFFGAQCQAAEVVERWVIESDTEMPSPFWWPFTFDLRMEDGRFAGWDPEAGEAGEPIADSFKW